MGVDRALGIEMDGVIIPLDGFALPLTAPRGRTGGHGAPIDRRGAAAGAGEIAATDKTQAGMIEAGIVKVVDHYAAARRAHIGIEFLFGEKSDCGRLELVAVVSAHLALAGYVIIGLSDAGMQQHVGIGENEA